MEDAPAMLDRIVRFGDALVAPMWGGEEAERVTLMMTLVGASCISFAMLMIWRHVLAPAIPAYATRTASDRVFLGNSFVSMWPAVTAPVLAIRSMAQLPWSDLDLLMVAPADEHALRAVGISCGYMLYDTIYCSVHREMRSPLIIGHHVLPVLFWPYCCLNHRALPIVLFFILTEITNIGQHLRMMLLKFGLEGRKVYTVIGVSWVIMFFAVRIAPSPYLFNHLVNGNYQAYSSWEFWCVFFLTPLPFILNSYWFYLLVTGVLKHLSKRAQSAQVERARLRKAL